MSHYEGSLNSEYHDYGWSEDAGERARLLQSPSVESGPKVVGKNGRGGTSAFSSVFIVVNAALGAGLLNFPAAFNTAGGVAAGIAVQMPPWRTSPKRQLAVTGTQTASLPSASLPFW
nr:PREDICTED: putative sodium-coupled neutral amino acid transporter 7 isoform X1 [Latimeria chalumnae]|eukprot:XP_014353655.1 PREDICTED: putative sodium-coupled neutral amino acid transporter 7 isoform X1 [Latimeria chalumnae]